MKNGILFAVSVTLLIILMSSKPSVVANAVVEQRMGLDVYVMSKPTKDYEVIESGKSSAWFSCNEIITHSVKQAKKSEADAVIIHFSNKRFDAIKYKDNL